jgi:tetratricopeptide (TPR) repeat protein
MSPLKKSRLISLYHLIEIGKFKDAKAVADEIIQSPESAEWANAWYAYGYLCQTAYGQGIEKNDPKLYQLYPDQLYLAWESYEKARSLDGSKRMERNLAPKYVLLANDFQSKGVKSFNEQNYDESLKAFEHALQIERLPFLSIPEDTLLIYNTALAAYEDENWTKANEYLFILHDYKYSANSTHLLFNVSLHLRDTATAEKVLHEGIVNFEKHDQLVFLLSELYYNTSRPDEALGVLEAAIMENPDNAQYYYNRGLIYQKTNQFQKAIEEYTESLKFDPENLMIYTNIATCYYNIGVQYEEKTLKLKRNQAVKEERAKAKQALKSSLYWLDSAIAKQPQDPEVISIMSQLYLLMGERDKTKTLIIYNE